MTVATVFGVATQLGGVVELGSAGRLVGGYSIQDYELELDGSEIDWAHDGEPVGEIAYAEIDEGNQLAVVGVVDAALTEIDEPLYWSGVYVPDAPYDRSSSFLVSRARVDGMALVLRSANSTARPLRWMPGDLRSSADRNAWPCTWRSSYPLLARAIDERQGSALRTRASRIVDLRVDSGSDYPWDEAPARIRRALGDVGRQQTGKLRHSGAAGRVLDVR